MRELFEVIDNCEAGKEYGADCADENIWGEKALVSDGKLILGESNEEGFFSKYEEAVCQMQTVGAATIETAGCFVTHWDRKQLVICGEWLQKCQCLEIKIGIMMGLGGNVYWNEDPNCR